MPHPEPALKKSGSYVRPRREALDISQKQLAERGLSNLPLSQNVTYSPWIEHLDSDKLA